MRAAEPLARVADLGRASPQRCSVLIISDDPTVAVADAESSRQCVRRWGGREQHALGGRLAIGCAFRLRLAAHEPYPVLWCPCQEQTQRPSSGCARRQARGDRCESQVPDPTGTPLLSEFCRFVGKPGQPDWDFRRRFPPLSDAREPALHAHPPSWRKPTLKVSYLQQYNRQR